MKKKLKLMEVLSARGVLLSALGMLLVLFSCTKESVGDDNGGGTNAGNNNDIEITEFSVNNVSGVVKQTEQTIKVQFIESTILDGLTPEIVFKGDRVIPDPQTPVDFSSSVADPVIYAVEGNDDRKEYKVSVEALNLQEFKPFVTIWKGDVDRIVIPTDPNLQYAYEINWGDGTIETLNGDAEHEFSGSNFGNREVQIRGIFPAVRFGDAGSDVTGKLQQIAQWGDIEWESMEEAFGGCSNLSITAIDKPNLDNVQSMKNMFRYALKQGEQPNFSAWDVGSVENMEGTFQGSKANPNVGDWDTGNVSTMKSMFENSEANPTVTSWDVSSLVTTESMFKNASKADPNLSEWNYNIGILKDMSHMLDYSNIQPRNLGYAIKRVSKALTNHYKGAVWNGEGVEWGAEGRRFCASSTGFLTTLKSYGWTFHRKGHLACVADEIDDVIDDIGDEIDDVIDDIGDWLPW